MRFCYTLYAHDLVNLGLQKIREGEGKLDGEQKNERGSADRGIHAAEPCSQSRREMLPPSPGGPLAVRARRRRCGCFGLEKALLVQPRFDC